MHGSIRPDYTHDLAWRRFTTTFSLLFQELHPCLNLLFPLVRRACRFLEEAFEMWSEKYIRGDNDDHSKEELDVLPREVDLELGRKRVVYGLDVRLQVGEREGRHF